MWCVNSSAWREDDDDDDDDDEEDDDDDEDEAEADAEGGGTPSGLHRISSAAIRGGTSTTYCTGALFMED